MKKYDESENPGHSTEFRPRNVNALSASLLFVYGSLMRAENGAFHFLLKGRAEFVGTGSFQGKLYRIAHYPGAVASVNPGDRVFGETYKIRNAAALFAELDRYELCSPGFPAPREYRRRQAPFLLTGGASVLAWLYLYNRPVSGLKRLN